jgi:hypothetical protein
MVRLGIVQIHGCLHIVVIKSTDQNLRWNILLFDYLVSYEQVHDSTVIIRCGSLRFPGIECYWAKFMAFDIGQAAARTTLDCWEMTMVMRNI